MAAINRNILPLSCCFLFVILVVVNDVSALTTQTDNNRMLSSQVYDTILSGNIAVIPNFLPAQEILALREDAAALHTSNHFSTDALASDGSSGTFDPAKDRAVLKLDQWKNPELGHWQTRTALANRMAALRTDLAYNLNRPHMDQGDAVHKYGAGSTEISYTRFGPGAFLKRHVDEHHEEIKGLAGWSQPTRRSISWLVYLNDPVDWNPAKNGGQLRCFARKTGGVSIHNGGAGLGAGARPNGDLQIGWLRATAFDGSVPSFWMGDKKKLASAPCTLCEETSTMVAVLLALALKITLPTRLTRIPFCTWRGDKQWSRSCW
jgi:hypothetical protein